MPSLDNRVILIVSPQAWGKMLLSKHHYAIELAERGNVVYFLNPPSNTKIDSKDGVEILPSKIADSLFFINHKPWFAQRLKFHALPLFHALMRAHVKKILKKIPHPLEIVWSFDLGNYYPFSLFGKAPLKIFHPVDEPQNTTAIRSAAGCDIIFSVTREIVEKYHDFSVPRFVINHGVSAKFLDVPSIGHDVHAMKRVGFSGNLLRNDIDRETVKTIVEQNPQLYFEFFGSYTDAQSNIGGAQHAESDAFIAFLQEKDNVRLHGVVGESQLAENLHQMDIFLICYDIEKDQSKGTNYHKIIEYLSTGKVIVSNNVTAYKDHPQLVTMTRERNNNMELPELFKRVVAGLEEYNNPEMQALRKSFARDNTYQKQIDRIEARLPEKKKLEAEIQPA